MNRRGFFALVAGATAAPAALLASRSEVVQITGPSWSNSKFTAHHMTVYNQRGYWHLRYDREADVWTGDERVYSGAPTPQFHVEITELRGI